MHFFSAGRWSRQCRRPVIALLTVLAHGAPAFAGEITFHVSDASGAPVEAAVVALYGDGLAAPEPRPDRVHVMDQIDKQFAPRVLVIRPGERVSFPNSDDIRHHVYSFSPAKTFELPLYHGTSTEPIAFEVSGTVALGCNIHDRMSAHIYVVDAPRAAVTDGGSAHFAALPDGRYEYVVHHRDLPRGTTDRASLVVESGSAVASVTLETRPVASNDDAELSPLERKFQALRRAQ